jgi:hypothetical protein
MPDQTPDPLETGLRSLATSAAQSVHGPAPEEIRRRGTRRRRVRVTAVAALSTAAVVAVGAVAFGVDRDLAGEPQPPATQETTVPTTPDLTPLSEANLPTAEELPGFNERTGWETTLTFPDAEQSMTSICEQTTLANVGAVEAWGRHYSQTTNYGPNTSPDPDEVPGSTGIVVAEFADESGAEEAYEQLRTWIEECPGGPPTPLGDIAGPQNSRGETFLLTYGRGTVNPTYPKGVGYPGTDVIDAQGVGIAGNRIVLVVQTQLGQDYVYAEGESPVEQALTIALTRLAYDADE